MTPHDATLAEPVRGLAWMNLWSPSWSSTAATSVEFCSSSNCR